jgi:hypothetical protein
LVKGLTVTVLGTTNQSAQGMAESALAGGAEPCEVLLRRGGQCGLHQRRSGCRGRRAL